MLCDSSRDIPKPIHDAPCSAPVKKLPVQVRISRDSHAETDSCPWHANEYEKTRGQDEKKAKDGKYFHGRCDAMSAEVAANLRAPVGPIPNVSEPDSHPCK